MLLCAASVPTSNVAAESVPAKNGARDCINASRIVQRRAVTADMLEITLSGGRVYRSRITQACPHLTGIDRTMTLQFDHQQGSQICAGDGFRVIDPVVARAGGAGSFPLCRFGRFVPAR